MILIADLGHTELDYSDEYDYDVSSPCGCSTVSVQLWTSSPLQLRLSKHLSAVQSLRYTLRKPESAWL